MQPRNMFNIDKEGIELACPRCGFYNPVTLKQIRLRDAVICRGCKVTINFEDHMNETRKAVRSINRAFRELQDQLDSMRTITIRF